MSFRTFLKPLVEAFPALATYYRYRRDLGYLTREVLYRDALGFKFNGPVAMEAGTFEREETRIFDKLIGNCDVFINIGANVGYYVCKALKLGVSTIAFEPNQLNVSILLRNIAANQFDCSFRCLPVALSDKPGVLPMFGGSTGASLIEGWAGQTQHTLVPVSTLDDAVSSLVAGKRCFVLIDIEGAELGCLKGASSLLSSETDHVFLVEISVGEHQPSGTKINPNLVETFSLMASFGYSAFTADNHLRRIELPEVKRVAETGVDTLATHNFLFVRSARS
jgi:FkbM family methyltransferase